MSHEKCGYWYWFNAFGLKEFSSTNCGLYLSVCVLQLHIAQVWFGMHALNGIVMMIVIIYDTITLLLE